MKAELLEALRAPFPAGDIEWRVMQAGAKGGNPWAKVVPYVTSRAIMDRLDAVFGPIGWQTRFEAQGDGHLGAGIGVADGEVWVWKWDGAGTMGSGGGLSSADAGKGDYSNALKRVGVQWGIGRYLYNLDGDMWANVHERGENYQGRAKDGKHEAFRWDPPALPVWALPTAPADEETLAAAQALDAALGETSWLEVHDDKKVVRGYQTARRLADSGTDRAAMERATAWLRSFNQGGETAGSDK